jgi:phosphoesterase RecJ-like protein
LPAAEVVVLLDCAQLSRVGPLGARLAASGAVVAVVDHHVGSEKGDGAVFYVDARAPATGAMVRRLYRALDVPLSPAAAEGVFLSLVADTGWFRYSNTDPEVLAMAAELVQAGVEPSSLYDRIHRRMHPDSAAILAVALQRHQLRLSGRLAIAVLDRGLMERAANIGFDTDLVLEPLRSLEGVEVVALIKERFDGTVKLSLRARTDVDVQRIAVSFGGGGHTKAAGATVDMSLAETVAAVESRVREAIAAGPQGRA